MMLQIYALYQVYVNKTHIWEILFLILYPLTYEFV